MSVDFNNPTPLQLGAKGTLDGRRYTVRGRVVLSVEIDGEDYGWNEYRLVADNGEEATLVHEEEEEGGPWKLFRLFEPLRPIAAREAAERRVGDTIDFGGLHARVTLVDQSVVRHVAGEAPEGVEVGDVASFFNTEAGERMIVVSWSGEEVECYEGRAISRGTVEQAFGLAAGVSAMQGSAGGWSSLLGDWSRGANRSLWIGGLLAVWALVNVIGSCDRGGGWAEPPAKVAAPAAQLAPGRTAALGGQTRNVAAHAIVEIARPEGIFDRHEYDLVNPDGTHELLVNSLSGSPAEWHLLSPAAAPADLPPETAAALRRGQMTTVDGRQLQVTQLFRGTTRQKEGQDPAGLWPAGLHYGLLARTKDTWVVLRWTDGGLRWYEGRAVPAQDVERAFGRRD